ncbi:hypothetical protein T265_11704 [Opisthorchis viverrini]|uniref:Peptidase A1 domain-containing protein n=1 Tax=Opisthorchis viverrini TaxID=6198 RepID=A0A074ZWK9_OPIVI|nr:hypothetical protein T265_11704 [Opisthorchis viverrini]KER19569.1 hypothetical protein T265_11704 [Opisthorchis viverrini]
MIDQKHCAQLPFGNLEDDFQRGVQTYFVFDFDQVRRRELQFTFCQAHFKPDRIPLWRSCGRHYCGPLSFGTPTQQFKMLFDTGSCSTWVRSVDSETEFTDQAYDHESSESAEVEEDYQTMEYANCRITGIVVNDVVKLGNQNIHISFANGVELSQSCPPIMRFDGIVGLCAVPGKASFLNQLFEAEIIDERIFSIWINPVRIDDGESEASSYLVAVDSGATKIWVPKSVLSKINHVLQPIGFDGRFYLVDCSNIPKKPIVHFEVGEFTLSMEPRYYIRSVPFDHNNCRIKVDLLDSGLIRNRMDRLFVGMSSLQPNHKAAIFARLEIGVLWAPSLIVVPLLFTALMDLALFQTNNLKVDVVDDLTVGDTG